MLRDLVLPEYAAYSSKSSRMHHHRPAATHMLSPVLALPVHAHRYTACTGLQCCHHGGAHLHLLQTDVVAHPQDHWQEHSYPLLHHMLLPEVRVEVMDYVLMESKLDRDYCECSCAINVYYSSLHRLWLALLVPNADGRPNSCSCRISPVLSSDSRAIFSGLFFLRLRAFLG